MGEFMDLIEGHKWRDEKEWQRTAQLASWFMSTQTKNAPTAAELLDKNIKKKKTNAAETKAVILDLTKRLGKGLVT